MKRLALCTFALFLIAAPALANDVQTVTITSGTIAASGSYSKAVNVTLATGLFSLQGRVTGSGTVKIEYECSDDGITYREPQGASDIAAGLTATSGPESDGRFILQFFPDFSKYLAITITETGGGSSAAFVGTLALETKAK